MKHTNTFNLLATALVLAIGVTGCHPKKGNVTPIPGMTGRPGGDKTYGTETNAASLPSTDQTTATALPPGSDIPLRNRFNPDEMNQDRDRFAANTVYFDFDRATIKPSETTKIDEVVRFLQNTPADAVQIEGHCDERGTEQYNLSLGERRALAVREYLVTAGIQAERVFTISYGESRPADPGHDEGAWAKNRRGVFVLLTPKQ